MPRNQSAEMETFDDINKKFGLTPLSPMEMNKIHFESGEYTPIDSSVSDSARPSTASKITRV